MANRNDETRDGPLRGPGASQPRTGLGVPRPRSDRASGRSSTGPRARPLILDRLSSYQGSDTLDTVLRRRQSVERMLEGYLSDDALSETDGAMPSRVNDEPGFILHTWDWSETSQLLDVLTLHYGRVFMVAKGAKRASSQMRGLLTPFCPVLFNWTGKKEAKQLSSVTWLGTMTPLTGETLMSGFYVNELVIRLCRREEVHPGLFAAYVSVLDTLALGDKADMQPALRAFETTILTLAGWQPVAPDYPEYPYYRVAEGELVGVSAEQAERFTEAVKDGALVVSREAVGALLTQDFTNKTHQRALRDILKALIQHHLGGREMNTRRILAELNQLTRL